MTISTVKLNSSSLPSPSGYTESVRWIGSATKLANGKIRRHLVAVGGKATFTITWSNINHTDFETIKTAYAAAVSASVKFTNPDGEEFDVTAAEDPALDGNTISNGRKLYYSLTITLVEDP